MNEPSSNFSGFGSHFPTDNESFDIKRYLSLFLSNWYWFAVALFIAFTIAYGINRYSEEVYSVSSTLLIQDEQLTRGSSGVESIIPGGDIFKSSQNLTNEIGILKSFSLNYRVISELPEFMITYVNIGRRGIAETKLYKNCPFIIIPDSNTIQPLQTFVYVTIYSKDRLTIEAGDEDGDVTELHFGDSFTGKNFSFKVIPRDSSGSFFRKNDFPRKYYFYFENPINLANLYRRKLNIFPIQEGASLVNLTVSGSAASQESDYLNKLMELYIKQGLEQKKSTADSTIKFINEQLSIISDSLNRAEDELENFKQTNKIIDIKNEGYLIQNRMEQFTDQQLRNDLQQMYYNYLVNYINSKNESGDIISPSMMGISDPLLIALVDNLAIAQKKKKQLDFNMTSLSPVISFLEKDIEIARQTLSENLKNTMNSLSISAENDKKLISDAEAEFAGLPQTERNMISIQRKYDLNNTVYTYLLEKRAEAGIAMASKVSENRIIDYAATFNTAQIKPKPKKNYTYALILGLLIPVIGIYIIDYLNNKIIDKKDIEEATKAPILGFISHNDTKEELPVITNPRSTLSESFRSVRTALKYFSKESDSLVVSVTSTISSEGKTFISVNLAAITALLGKKVLLVGLDLRKPRIHKVFEIENGNGLSTYLSGNCEYEDLIQETKIKNLFYAPSGPIPPNPAELIESERMKLFFERARKDFDYIVIDTPPVAVVTDALLLVSFVDINIFVVRQRYTSKNTLGLIQELYESGKFKNFGIIINDISLSGYYGYGLRYGYSMGYGYSYGYNLYGQSGYYRYGYSNKDNGYYSEE
jgi:capsular exopolysaccharide synthesis family protein